MMALYSGGMFILISTTMDLDKWVMILMVREMRETYMKYIPMIWEKNNTRTLELLDEEIQMKNLDIVSNKPLQ